jgi:hypothetical protein
MAVFRGVFFDVVNIRHASLQSDTFEVILNDFNKAGTGDSAKILSSGAKKRPMCLELKVELIAAVKWIF